MENDTRVYNETLFVTTQDSENSNVEDFIRTITSSAKGPQGGQFPPEDPLGLGLMGISKSEADKMLGLKNNKPDADKPEDPLGLGKLGYSREQVDSWLGEGYTVTQIRSGDAARGVKANNSVSTFDYESKMEELLESVNATLKTKNVEDEVASKK
jgi:hypothetical protein